MSNDAPETFGAWSIVDLFGHTTLAGFVTEATIGGQGFIRLDVPSVNGGQAFTKFLGPGSIYSLTIVEEAVARAALERLRPVPVSVYLLPAPQPPQEGYAYDLERDESEPDDEDDGRPRF